MQPSKKLRNLNGLYNLPQIIFRTMRPPVKIPQRLNTLDCILPLKSQAALRSSQRAISSQTIQFPSLHHSPSGKRRSSRSGAIVNTFKPVNAILGSISAAGNRRNTKFFGIPLECLCPSKARQWSQWGGGWGILPTNCIIIVSFSLKQRNEGTKVREKVLVDKI